MSTTITTVEHTLTVIKRKTTRYHPFATVKSNNKENLIHIARAIERYSNPHGFITKKPEFRYTITTVTVSTDAMEERL